MGGLEAARRIRALDRPDAKSIPIVALSANAYSDDVQRSINAGMKANRRQCAQWQNGFQNKMPFSLPTAIIRLGM